MAESVVVHDNKNKNVWGGGTSPMKASYGKLMMWFFLLSDAFTFSGLLAAYGHVRFAFKPYVGSPENYMANPESWWPVPEQVFNAIPFVNGHGFPLVFVGIMTFILILSSVTMVLAVDAGHRMDKKGVEKWMLWTIIGGITFLGCQAWEWSHFIHGTHEGIIMLANDQGWAHWTDATHTAIQVYQNGTWVAVAPEKFDLVMKGHEIIQGANLHVNEYGPAAFADFFFFITGFHGTHVLSGIIINIIIFFQASTGVLERRGHYEMIEKVGLYWHFVDLVWVFVFTFFYLV